MSLADASERAAKYKAILAEALERENAANLAKEKRMQEEIDKQIAALPAWFDDAFQAACKRGLERVHFQELVHTSFWSTLTVGALDRTDENNSTRENNVPWERVAEIIKQTFPEDLFDVQSSCFHVVVSLKKE